MFAAWILAMILDQGLETVTAILYSLDTAMKRAAGFTADYPSGAGEKIICLKNRHDLGLVNGRTLPVALPADRLRVFR